MSDETTKQEQREVEALNERHEFIVKQNNDTLADLRSKGIDIRGESLLAERLEFFIMGILGGKDSMDRLRFEIAWQERVQRSLAETKKAAEKEMRERSLAAHPQPPRRNGSGLIIPGQ